MFQQKILFKKLFFIHNERHTDDHDDDDDWMVNENDVVEIELCHNRN